MKPEKTEKFTVVYTDTFGGEPNFSWVYRESIEVPERASQALIMRKAKRAHGLNGVRGRVIEVGHDYEFRPYGQATILLVCAEE